MIPKWLLYQIVGVKFSLLLHGIEKENELWGKKKRILVSVKTYENANMEEFYINS